MKRISATYTVTNFQDCKQQMLNWANRFNICCFMDNHFYSSTYSSYDCLVAVGSVDEFITDGKDEAIQHLKDFLNTHRDWLFGHVAYDFKNHIFPLQSAHNDGIQFPDVFLFQPEIVLQLRENELIISSLITNPAQIFEELFGKQADVENSEQQQSAVHIRPRIAKDEYITIIQQLKRHLQLGDCYEINFCQEFFDDNASIHPLEVYQKLSSISPTPFNCFYKLHDKYLLCASPERFVKKTGDTIISQPIKGTAKRDLINKQHDDLLKQQLQQSQKERNENVMIVDLVRNDLSKIATRGSVRVEELFGVYTYPQVHHIISTVAATIPAVIDFADVLQAAFPMGSMTGAPKYRVMQLIEEYEKTKRGIYSGSVGYITPDGDFDFNVVIRSIMYNATEHYLNYQVGGAITHYSDAESEYEECLLKAKAMEKTLQTF